VNNVTTLACRPDGRQGTGRSRSGGARPGTTISQSCHIDVSCKSSRGDSPWPRFLLLHGVIPPLPVGIVVNPRVGPVRFIRGCDGDVRIDASCRLVTKTYVHPDPGTAIANARREVDRASRFYEALADVPGITSPKILACDFSMPPRVVMEQCLGRPLLDFLARVGANDPRIPQISGRIRLGLEIYTRLFAEPYYDFCFNNMLFDEAEGTIAFLDFVIPHGASDDGQSTPIEASLGWLVGCTCYEVVRPTTLASSSNEGCLELMRSVVSEFEGQIRVDRLCARARHASAQMYDGGGRLRRRYYKTFGSLVTSGLLRRLARASGSR
jgi:hypothetical protein